MASLSVAPAPHAPSAMSEEMRNALQSAANSIVGEIRGEGGGGGEGAQYGLVVPGPIGAPRVIKAHGGEVVLNLTEQRVVQEVLGAAVKSSPGRPQTIIVQLDGREIMHATLPHFEDAVKNGQMIIHGR